MKLRELANESLVDVTLGLKISDAYKNKSDANKGLFAMLDMAPDAKQAKRADGTFAVRLAGPLGRLKPAPAGAGSAMGSAVGPGMGTFKGGSSKPKLAPPKDGAPKESTPP